ncbi:MAG: AAA family ATPase, partial [Desulfurococcales archaeon]|nr:AAA family ATPase [Desulfurococcales archaeon]
MTGDNVGTAIDILLLSGKSVLLAGAPGTGKTRLGLDTARSFTGIDPVVIVGRGDMVARELLYSYEPLNSGFRVVLGPLSLSVLASWARLLAGLPPRWLLLDEINRMNAETVLGNLFTALDLAHRQRVEVVPRWLVERVLGDDFLVEEVADIAGFEKSKVRKLLEKALYKALAGPDKLPGLPLPFSWRVIATMNLVDRAHLFRLGFALLRRFPLVLVPGVGGKVWPELRTERIENIEKTMPNQVKLLYKNLQSLIRDEICRSSIDQLFVRSNITEYDRPVYILGMGDNIVHETLNMFANVVKIAAILIAEMSSIGVEIGPALLADICRVLLIARLYYTSASDN